MLPRLRSQNRQQLAEQQNLPHAEVKQEQDSAPRNRKYDELRIWMQKRRWSVLLWLCYAILFHGFIWNFEGINVYFFKFNSLTFFFIMDFFYCAELIMYFWHREVPFTPAKLLFLYSIGLTRLMEDSTKRACRLNTMPDVIVIYCYKLWSLDLIFLGIPLVILLHQGYYVDDFLRLNTPTEWKRSFFTPFLGYLLFNLSEHLFPS